MFMTDNKMLHLTAISLRFMAAGELYLYIIKDIDVNGSVPESEYFLDSGTDPFIRGLTRSYTG